MIGEFIFLIVVFCLTTVGFFTTIDYMVNMWYYYKQVYQNRIAFRSKKT